MRISVIACIDAYFTEWIGMAGIAPIPMIFFLLSSMPTFGSLERGAQMFATAEPWLGSYCLKNHPRRALLVKTWKYSRAPLELVDETIGKPSV